MLASKIRWSRHMKLPPNPFASEVKYQLPAVPKEKRIRYWDIAVGDLVLVAKGPGAGQRGRVLEVNPKTNGVVVQGVNVRTVKVPEYLLQPQDRDGKEKLIDVAHEVPYDSLRLLTLSTDENGEQGLKPVEIKRGKLFFNKEKRQLTWKRWIVGENRFLPWPKAPNNRPKPVVGPMDTTEAIAAQVTWKPTLETPPIPLSVSDELHSRMSRRNRKEWARETNKNLTEHIAVSLLQADKRLKERLLQQEMEKRASQASDTGSKQVPNKPVSQ
ncbi:ribosomal protein subunit L40 [Schizosaccharomyces japonicus yFS275]|uniref:Ribosomal protein subunit L40 n=1 Tax=Schizosaccharomyces japonicus (strain yFS275 / FY16936) TaxID=402676 RepID=B6K6Y9_SCHJY|nr:ribosomal protein subunit L40 [Schizosaccharomyces japonicus yFS275]EEB09293.1 ribosomal protein subunit L40 [Schizosaccharomyces japonicus yFS275]